MTKKSAGAFKPEAWQAEGERLLAVARLNRDLFRRRRRGFHEKISKPQLKKANATRLWNELEGTARTPWLLVGYAVEMYLKAGLARAYAGCAESMFKRDVKIRYSHNLAKISREIAFPSAASDNKRFRDLKERLVAGRYPPFASNGVDDMEYVNAQTHKEWSDDEFKKTYDLATRVRAHCARLDSDNKCPAKRMSVSIDEDGYLAFRTGGHLPTRITYRVSSVQRKHGETTLQDVISLFKGDDRFHRINCDWDNAMILEDGKDDNGQEKTYRRDHNTGD